MTNLAEKPCRSKRKRKLREKPAAKARPILKPSSISDVNSILVGQRKWIYVETQEPNDPCCFQVTKFITRFLRHNYKVHREDDGAVHYDQVIGECKKTQSDNAEYWSDEMKKDFVNGPEDIRKGFNIA